MEINEWGLAPQVPRRVGVGAMTSKQTTPRPQPLPGSGPQVPRHGVAAPWGPTVPTSGYPCPPGQVFNPNVGACVAAPRKMTPHHGPYGVEAPPTPSGSPRYGVGRGWVGPIAVDQNAAATFASAPYMTPLPAQIIAFADSIVESSYSFYGWKVLATGQGTVGQLQQLGSGKLYYFVWTGELRSNNPPANQPRGLADDWGLSAPTTTTTSTPSSPLVDTLVGAAIGICAGGLAGSYLADQLAIGAVAGGMLGAAGGYWYSTPATTTTSTGQ